MYNDIKSKKKKSKSIFSRIFHRRTKRLFSNIELEFQRFLDAHTFFSIFFIFLGVVFIIWSSIPDIVLRIGIGICFLSYGILEFYFFFQRRKLSFYKFFSFFGIFSLFIGIFSLFQGNMKGILNLLALFYLLVTLERFFELFYLIRLHDKDVFVFFFSILLNLFIAILLFINPFQQLLGREILGVFAILFSIINISELSFLSRKSGTFLSFFE